MSFPTASLEIALLKDRGLLHGLVLLRIRRRGPRGTFFNRSRRDCRILLRRLHRCPRLDRPDGILWPTDEYAVEPRLAAALPAANQLESPACYLHPALLRVSLLDWSRCFGGRCVGKGFCWKTNRLRSSSYESTLMLLERRSTS